MAMTTLESGFLVPDTYRKAAPPKTGPKFGNWQGPVYDYDTRRQMANGGLLQFDLSKLTLADFRSMREHYQINISLAILTFSLHQIHWWIECDDQKIADFLEENLRHTWTRMIRAVSQAYWAGYSPIVLEYKNDPISGRYCVSKFKDLIPEECEVNWKKQPGAAMGGQRPTTRYVYDGIKQHRGGVQVTDYAHSSKAIPADATWWYPVLKENGDMRGRKLLRPAFAPWFYSQIIHLYANRYFERFGEPLIVGRYPNESEVPIRQEVDGTVTSKPAREVMEQIVTNVRNSAAVVMPSDRAPNVTNSRADGGDFEWMIEYLESQMRGSDFERYLQRLDEEMSLAMFAPVLLFRTADVGSYNLGQAHEKLFYQMMNGLVGDVAETLERHVLYRLTDYNFSPRAPRPKFKWRALGQDDPETTRTLLQSVIQQQIAKPSLDDIGQISGMDWSAIPQAAATEVGPGTGTPDPNSELSRFDTAGAVMATIERSAVANWGEPDWSPKLGHFREMALSYGADLNVSESVATDIVEGVYGRVQAAVPDIIESSHNAAQFVQNLGAKLRDELR